MIDRLGRRHADIVRLRFNADKGKPLTVEALDRRDQVIRAGGLFDIAAWLERYNYRYVLGTNGIWAHVQVGRAA